MQSLTELRLTLASLQDRIGGLQTEIDGCVEFLDALTGGVPVPLPKRRGPYNKTKAKAKTNGSAGKAISADVFREQVRTHFTNNRRAPLRRTIGKHAQTLDAALEAARKKHKGVPDPSPGTLTTQEVAKRLRLSDAGVRNLVEDGRLPEPRLELRRFGSFHSFRPTLVHRLADIEAYSVSRVAPMQSPAVRRVTGTAPVRPGKKMSKLARRRQISADYLEQYDPHQPRMIPSPGNKTLMGPLVRRGYLKKKGDGYVRTSKPFSVQVDWAARREAKEKRAKANGTGKPARAAKAPTGSWKAQLATRRQATVDMLAKFDAEEPRPASIVENHRVVGVMVQHGYLRQKNGGYVRTEKEYHP